VPIQRSDPDRLFPQIHFMLYVVVIIFTFFTSFFFPPSHCPLYPSRNSFFSPCPSQPPRGLLTPSLYYSCEHHIPKSNILACPSLLHKTGFGFLNVNQFFVFCPLRRSCHMSLVATPPVLSPLCVNSRFLLVYAI